MLSLAGLKIYYAERGKILAATVAHTAPIASGLWSYGTRYHSSDGHHQTRSEVSDKLINGRKLSAK